jgi:NADPH-dependent 2,4-dienoyl-CoA reductase/sulfur reductase-like enzyme
VEAVGRFLEGLHSMSKPLHQRDFAIAIRALLWAVLTAVPAAKAVSAAEPAATCDVVVYGGTPGGITAAVAAARHGCSAVLVEPRHRSPWRSCTT